MSYIKRLWRNNEMIVGISIWLLAFFLSILAMNIYQNTDHAKYEAQNEAKIRRFEDVQYKIKQSFEETQRKQEEEFIKSLDK